MVISVDIEVTKKEGLASRAQSGIMEYLATGADKGLAVASDRVPVDRGAGGGLLGQMFAELDHANNRVVWGVRDAPHARAIEEGTGPFAPPYEPILDWAERVTGDRGFGFYVHWKIRQEGIDAQPYIAPGREAQLRWYRSHSASYFIDREFR